MAQKFFTPTDVFAVNGADWKIQSGANAKNTSELAAEPGSSGDIIATFQHGKKASGSCVYTSAAKTTGNYTIPKPGTITAGGWHIDSVSLAAVPAGWVKLTVTGHKHNDGIGHATGGCKTYTASPTFVVRVGVGRSVGGIVVLDDEAVIGMRGWEYTFTVNHQDEYDGDGEHLAGENNNGVEKLKVDFTGEVDVSADLTLAAGWDLDSDGLDAETNTSAVTTSVELTHYVSADA